MAVTAIMIEGQVFTRSEVRRIRTVAPPLLSCCIRSYIIDTFSAADEKI
jgi:hypothetical protein